MKTDKDYTCMATKAKDALCTCGIPLHDSIVKIAQEHRLNPHEVRRVVEKTNVLVHMDGFEKKAEDKYVTFKVANPDKILDELFGVSVDTETGAPDAIKCAYDASSRLPDEVNGEATITKLASANDEEYEDTGHYTQPFTITEDFSYKVASDCFDFEVSQRREKVAQELQYNVTRCEREFFAGVEKVASSFRKLGAPSFEKLASQCLSLRDDQYVRYALTKVASLLRNAPDLDTLEVPRVTRQDTWSDAMMKVADCAEELHVCAVAYRDYASEHGLE